MRNEVYTIKRIASVVGGEVIGNQSVDYIIRNILFDSRLFVEPENTVFFALTGGRNDGHKYITELYEKGVRAFVVNANLNPVSCKALISVSLY